MLLVLDRDPTPGRRMMPAHGVLSFLNFDTLVAGPVARTKTGYTRREASL